MRELLELWNEHRIGEGTVHFSEDVELEAQGMPQLDFSDVYRGHEGFGTWVRDWLSAWEHTEADLMWLASRDEQVVAWVHMRLIGKGSGVPVEMDGGWGFWFRDDKICRVRLYVDEQKARDELGAEVAHTDPLGS